MTDDGTPKLKILGTYGTPKLVLGIYDASYVKLKFSDDDGVLTLKILENDDDVSYTEL
ncbi:6269_t:CDS:1 [Ambispora leptoticha]|uniref:6269_t:CDS:1 n=1 Tax=Ambispora leptoticha TaxID=144679 RepID=A0A9N9C4B2_9GLOM|nr:6269_t:CDS:1 [Ambispora leptoticha]